MSHTEPVVCIKLKSIPGLDFTGRAGSPHTSWLFTNFPFSLAVSSPPKYAVNTSPGTFAFQLWNSWSGIIISQAPHARVTFGSNDRTAMIYLTLVFVHNTPLSCFYHLVVIFFAWWFDGSFTLVLPAVGPFGLRLLATLTVPSWLFWKSGVELEPSHYGRELGNLTVPQVHRWSKHVKKKEVAFILRSRGSLLYSWKEIDSFTDAVSFSVFNTFSAFTQCCRTPEMNVSTGNTH